MSASSLFRMCSSDTNPENAKYSSPPCRWICVFDHFVLNTVE